jgi:hypothetical protein
MLIYAVNPGAEYPVPISRCQIVRRHVAENNSLIRISGCVEGALVENCTLKKNHRGVEIMLERGKERDKAHFINSPVNALLRHNRFEGVFKSGRPNFITPDHA